MNNKLIEKINKLKKELEYIKTEEEYKNFINKNFKNKYSLNYKEYREEIEEILEENKAVLVEDKKRRIKNGDNYTTHKIIEGDNYAGLKILKDKNIKVDVIYIDPPYNTGNDFTFNDNFKEDNDKHSAWLSFMNKRLKLARDILNEDGIIFISIDDNELYNLKLLLDNIFGEENFLANIIWNKGYGKNNSKFFRNVTEYILVYTKDKNKVKEEFLTIKDGYLDVTNIVKKYKGKGKDVLEEKIKEYYKNNSQLKGIRSYNMVEEETYRLFSSVTLESPSKGSYFYNVIHPLTNKPCKIPNKGWNRTEESMKELIKRNEIIFGKDETTIPRRKYYLDEMKYETPKNIVTNLQQGGTEIKEIMGDIDFNYPKPSSLLKELLKLVNKPNATVLDFFAGSGTTLQTVLELNKEDKGNRQCILININEINNNNTAKYLNKNYNTSFKLTKAGNLSKQKKNIEQFNSFINSNKFKEIKNTEDYKNLGICRRVTYRRSKRIIQGYTNNRGKKIEGLKENNLKYYTVEYKKNR